MATDTRAGKGPAPAKYDTFVAAQLGRAESRIRTLDLAAALLGFVAATLAFAVLMAAIDSRWNLAPGSRRTALWLYLLGAGVYLFFLVILPLRRRINPYYAARKVEATVPGAKNSVINWVDLHDQQLAPAIRGAVGQRAARDLGRADIDRAISGRRAGWAGGLAGAAAVGFLIAFFLLGPGPFFSILGRTFTPFGGGGIPTRTQLSMVQPVGGDATVTVDRPITLVVHVDGRLPDPNGPEAVRLLYRYEEDDSQERLLRPADGSERDWEITLPAADVRNGFWYRITAGDGSTPMHRITVRAAPALTEFLATYHFRPYVAHIDEINHERDLKALRGTEVLLHVRTNRAVKDARFEWEGKDGPQSFPAQTDPADPQTFQVRRVIDNDARYRLAFTSTDGETYIDPAPHAITAIPDLPPRVELTKPGQDVSLPANALLPLEGKATDDIGVQGVVLRAQIPGGPRLQPQPYRSQEKLRLVDGGYPLAIEYKDSLDLGAVKGEDGKAVVLKAGMEVEYWLEASDACDYDRPHFGQSQRFKVKITDPDKDAARRKQERQKAEEERKKHDQQQDRRLQQENKQRQEERKQQEAKNEEERGKNDQPKNGEGKKEPKENPGETSEDPKPKDGRDEKGNNPDDAGLTPEQKDQQQRLEDALNKQKQQQDKGGGKGEDKPDKQQGPGESKPDKQGEGQKGGEQGNAGQKSEGEGKDAGKQGAAGAGEDKKQGQQGGDKQAAEAKGGGQPDPMKGGQGEPKPDAGKGPAGQEAKAEEKGKGKQGGGDRRAEAKAGGPSEKSQKAGQDKPEGKPAPEGAQAKGEPRDAGAEGAKPENRQTLGEKKENGGQGGKCEKCEGKGAGGGSRADQGAAKAGGAPGENGKNGEGKPNGGGGKNVAQADPKPGSGGGADGRRAEDARPEDVERLAKDLQGGDEQAAEDAARKLEQIKEQARNPQARDAANEALDEMKKNQGAAKAGESKAAPKPMGDPAQPGPKTGNAGGEAKGGKAGGEPGAGDAKSEGGGNTPENKGEGKNQGEKREGDPKNPNAPGTAKGPRGRLAGNDPDNGQVGAGSGAERPVGDKDGLEGKASRPEAHRPGALQLDDFKKRVDKKILDDARMTEEEYQKFLRAYEEALRRRKETPRAEALPPAQQAGGPLPSFVGGGGKTGNGRPTDVGSDTKALPPAPYRDAYNKFTRELSRPADKK